MSDEPKPKRRRKCVEPRRVPQTELEFDTCQVSCITATEHYPPTNEDDPGLPTSSNLLVYEQQKPSECEKGNNSEGEGIQRGRAPPTDDISSFMSLVAAATGVKDEQHHLAPLTIISLANPTKLPAVETSAILGATFRHAPSTKAKRRNSITRETTSLVKPVCSAKPFVSPNLNSATHAAQRAVSNEDRQPPTQESATETATPSNQNALQIRTADLSQASIIPIQTNDRQTILILSDNGLDSHKALIDAQLKFQQFLSDSVLVSNREKAFLSSLVNPCQQDQQQQIKGGCAKSTLNGHRMETPTEIEHPPPLKIDLANNNAIVQYQNVSQSREQALDLTIATNDDGNQSNATPSQKPSPQLADHGALLAILQSESVEKTPAEKNQTTSPAAVSKIVEREELQSSGQRSPMIMTHQQRSKASRFSPRDWLTKRRVEANKRERIRVCGISNAFEVLRSKIPTLSTPHRLSKLSILRIASAYIQALASALGHDYTPKKTKPSLQECLQNLHQLITTEHKSKRPHAPTADTSLNGGDDNDSDGLLDSDD